MSVCVTNKSLWFLGAKTLWKDKTFLFLDILTVCVYILSKSIKNTRRKIHIRNITFDFLRWWPIESGVCFFCPVSPLTVLVVQWSDTFRFYKTKTNPGGFHTLLVYSLHMPDKIFYCWFITLSVCILLYVRSGGFKCFGLCLLSRLCWTKLYKK